MNARLYTLIAIIVCITAIWLLNRLNDKGTFKSNATFRYTASFFIGGFWIILVPAIVMEFIIYQCCWHFSLIDWGATFKELWKQIKDFFKRIFKCKKK